MSDEDRLYRCVERKFLASGETEWPTVSTIARGLRWSQQRVIDTAEGSHRFMLDVAIGCGGGIGDLEQRDWMVETVSDTGRLGHMDVGREDNT